MIFVTTTATSISIDNDTSSCTTINWNTCAFECKPLQFLHVKAERNISNGTFMIAGSASCNLTYIICVSEGGYSCEENNQIIIENTQGICSGMYGVTVTCWTTDCFYTIVKIFNCE